MVVEPLPYFRSMSAMQPLRTERTLPLPNVQLPALVQPAVPLRAEAPLLPAATSFAARQANLRYWRLSFATESELTCSCARQGPGEFGGAMGELAETNARVAQVF
jgi:hypothetical protein